MPSSASWSSACRSARLRSLWAYVFLSPSSPLNPSRNIQKAAPLLPRLCNQLACTRIVHTNKAILRHSAALSSTASPPASTTSLPKLSRHAKTAASTAAFRSGWLPNSASATASKSTMPSLPSKCRTNKDQHWLGTAYRQRNGKVGVHSCFE